MSEQNNNQLVDLEAEERERQQRQIQRERARQERNHQRQIQRYKRKIIGRLVIIALVLVVALLYVFIFRYPHQKIEDDIIKRDLGRGPEFITALFTEQRDLVWDSELPKFVEKDFKLAEEKGYTIEYKFGAYTITGRIEDGKPYIILDSPFDMYLSFSFYEKKENFSMYYNSEADALVLFGYPAESPSQFERIILYADPSKFPDDRTLTYEKDLPLTMDIYDSIYAISCGDYCLMFNEEDSTFYFYKDGEVVSSRKFHDTVKTVHRYRGFIETENKLLYKIYAYQKDGIPDLKFVFIESDVSLLPDSHGYSYQSITSQNMTLPIIQKNGRQFYTILPEDWDVFENYGHFEELNEYKQNLNYNIGLISLEDKFVYAEFSYGSGWKVNLNFAIDGNIFWVTYDVDGYDKNFNLTDEEKEALSIRVESVDEMWTHIEKIRDVYHSHYSKSFDDLLKRKYR